MARTRGSRIIRFGRPLALGAAAIVLAGALTGCLKTPGDTSKVVKVASTDVAGWHYDYYENRAYPCSISGFQTFAIGTKVGSSQTANRPLWVKMRGGGLGWFDAAGKPQPSAANKAEISLTEMLRYDDPGLMAKVKAAPEGFRTLLVSMCSHDLYAGNNNTDPHNPFKTAAGKPRLTNGLIATKAAVQFAQSRYPTTDYFLHGTSAGGAGTFHVAWALQLQGLAPAGLVSDSGIVDVDRSDALPPECVNDNGGQSHRDELAARVDPTVADPDNQPDLLVERGQLTVPVLHVWSHGDPNTCGRAAMTCERRNGSTVQLGAADCRHENLRAAIAAQGPTSRSQSLGVCVTLPSSPGPCATHVVTTREGARNTDPSSPANYQSVILTWVRARLADRT